MGWVGLTQFDLVKWGGGGGSTLSGTSNLPQNEKPLFIFLLFWWFSLFATNQAKKNAGVLNPAKQRGSSGFLRVSRGFPRGFAPMSRRPAARAAAHGAGERPGAGGALCAEGGELSRRAEGEGKWGLSSSSFLFGCTGIVVLVLLFIWLRSFPPVGCKGNLSLLEILFLFFFSGGLKQMEGRKLESVLFFFFCWWHPYVWLVCVVAPVLWLLFFCGTQILRGWFFGKPIASHTSIACGTQI